jgi:hypothetical protein
MNLNTRFARRYHWRRREDFVRAPHEAVVGERVNGTVNAIEADKEKTRRLLLDLLRENPRNVASDFLRAMAALKGQGTLDGWVHGGTIGLLSQEAKLVYLRPIDERSVIETLKRVHEGGPNSLEDSLLMGMGPSTARALYLVADLIYREPLSYRDPVTYPYDPFKYAFAIGGKDGIPFPVNREVAEEVIVTLEEIIEMAKVEEGDRRRALNGLMKLGEGR